MTSVSQILNDFDRFGPGHSLSWDQNHNNTLETWQTLLFYCTILKFVVKLGKCTPLRGFAYDLRISCCCMCVLLPNQPIYVCFFCCCWIIVMVLRRLGPKVYPKPSNTFDNCTTLWFCLEKYKSLVNLKTEASPTIYTLSQYKHRVCILLQCFFVNKTIGFSKCSMNLIVSNQLGLKVCPKPSMWLEICKTLWFYLTSWKHMWKT